MSQVKYEAAIVMGTLHGIKLPDEIRDSRVQTMMLLLRSTQAILYGADQAPLHVIGENALDASAALALTPASRRNVPDFVNTQAINARALTQALAYPLMQAAIAQLFYNVPGSPQMCLVNPGEHLIPVGQASFADVMETVKRKFPDDVVVGLVTSSGEMVLTPGLDFVHEYVEDDQIIVLSRRFSIAADEHVDPVEKAKRAGLEELERAKEAGEKAEEDDLAWEKLNLMNASATQAQKDLSSPPPAAPVALPGSIGDTDAGGDRPADEARKEEEPTHEAAACVDAAECFAANRLVAPPSAFPASSDAGSRAGHDDDVGRTALARGGGEVFAKFLRYCGLEGFEQALREEGFDSVGTLTALSDADLRDFGFRKGHMLKLRDGLSSWTG